MNSQQLPVVSCQLSVKGRRCGPRLCSALPFSVLSASLFVFSVLCLSVSSAEDAEQKRERAQLLAPDGVPYDNESSFDVMAMKPLSGNLLLNGSFEAGRYWPAGWEPTDGLTLFWVPGGTDGKRCMRIYTDVLDAQWKMRFEEVRAAVDAAARRAGGDPQALPKSPIPPAPERIPTTAPYYDTVAGLHGVHYRSHYVKVAPRAVYRFSIDARTEVKGEPKVFVKGFFDQRMKTKDGTQTVRRDAYQAPIFLDPCDGQWRRYARTFHPSRSKSTLDKKELKTEYLQVQIYAYWKPGSYYFDNARLEIVGYETPQEKGEDVTADPPKPRLRRTGPELGEDEFPTFDP